jgi:hypothetical protein
MAYGPALAGEMHRAEAVRICDIRAALTAPVILGCGENLWPSQVQRHWLTTKRKFAIAYVPNARPANVQTCGAICGRAAEAANANASGSTSYVVDNNGLTESALHAAHRTAARVNQTSIAGIAVAAPSRCNAHRSTFCQ